MTTRKRDLYQQGMRNDGMVGYDYVVFPGEDALNRQITDIVNEAWHIHRHHPGGWKRLADDKDHFARGLDDALGDDPDREEACLALKDRVLSMLIYRARELRAQSKA